MNIEKAKQQLVTLRQQQRSLRKTIDNLRKQLHEKGIDPDPPAVDLTERNKTIYSRHLDGVSYAEIAQEFKLSKERIKLICQRVEYRNEKAALRAMKEEKTNEETEK